MRWLWLPVMLNLIVSCAIAVMSWYILTGIGFVILLLTMIPVEGN